MKRKKSLAFRHTLRQVENCLLLSQDREIQSLLLAGCSVTSIDSTGTIVLQGPTRGACIGSQEGLRCPIGWEVAVNAATNDIFRIIHIRATVAQVLKQLKKTGTVRSRLYPKYSITPAPEVLVLEVGAGDKEKRLARRLSGLRKQAQNKAKNQQRKKKK